MSSKPKEELIEAEGTIIAAHGRLWSVQLDNGHVITAHLGGKLKTNFIKIAIGDRVTVEITPYDLTKGRIVYRK